jgi:hypothetical protein
LKSYLSFQCSKIKFLLGFKSEEEVIKFMEEIPPNYKPEYLPTTFDSKKFLDPDQALRQNLDIDEFERKRLLIAQNFWSNPIDYDHELL